MLTVDFKVNQVFKLLGIYETCGKDNFTKYANDTMLLFSGMEDEVSEIIACKIKGLINNYDEQDKGKVKSVVFNMISLLKR